MMERKESDTTKSWNKNRRSYIQSGLKYIPQEKVRELFSQRTSTPNNQFLRHSKPQNQSCSVDKLERVNSALKPS